MPDKLFADIGIHRLSGEVDDYFDLQLFYGKMKVVLKAGAIIREIGPRFILHGRNGSFVKYGLDPQEVNLRSGMTPDNELLGVDDESNYGIIHFEKNENVIRENLQTVDGAYYRYFENISSAIKEKKN
ncbi:MAG: Gfo/Idh/MocA family oxidoreductase [Prolixibacteraceae bacterium]|jgi:scyllo-inositol 2-dehydrogenase (NADP+)|nr:Gfo/Idh/MocA family oxidoreductase [Prolixibacteraceae bacterium]